MRRRDVRDAAFLAAGRTPWVERLAQVMLAGVVLRRFYSRAVGDEYGLDRRAKRRLIRGFRRIGRDVKAATGWLDYVVLASRILSIPRSLRGDVVECGCYKGASTAALSLVCAVVGRRLLACDSFRGLPRDEADAAHNYPHLGVSTQYQAGLFAGNLEEVSSNVQTYGDPGVCQFVPGFFAESLSALRDPIVFAFLDVDLAGSMRDCLRHVWPLLVDGGRVYTDDSCDMEVVKIWFDEAFWGTLGTAPPGYVGSGCGLPAMSTDYSSLGYGVRVLSPGSVYRAVTFW